MLVKPHGGEEMKTSDKETIERITAHMKGEYARAFYLSEILEAELLVKLIKLRRQARKIAEAVYITEERLEKQKDRLQKKNAEIKALLSKY